MTCISYFPNLMFVLNLIIVYINKTMSHVSLFHLLSWVSSKVIFLFPNFAANGRKMLSPINNIAYKKLFKLLVRFRFRQ